jgi:Mrp family chromosome partitioning ATPase
MTSILETLRERYTTIVIDTPPVNVVTDSMELAKNVSGIVMVVRYGITTNDDVDEAMNKVNFSQLNVLGFIMNSVKVGGGKYYSKYHKYGKYGKYSKYGKYGKGYSYGYYGETPRLNDNSDSAESTDKAEPEKKEAPKSETVKKEAPKTEKNASQKNDSISNKKNGKNKKGGK